MAYNTPEGKIKKRGRDICRKLDLYFFPVQQGGTSLAGIPDDVLCVNGKFVHIEYKAHMDWRPTSKVTATSIKTLPTEKQCKAMERCRVSGGITLVVDDSNIDHLLGDLETIAGGKSGENIPLYSGWKWFLIDYMRYRSGALSIYQYSPGYIPHPEGTQYVWRIK